MRSEGGGGGERSGAESYFFSSIIESRSACVRDSAEKITRRPIRFQQFFNASCSERVRNGRQSIPRKTATRASHYSANLDSAGEIRCITKCLADRSGTFMFSQCSATLSTKRTRDKSPHKRDEIRVCVWFREGKLGFGLSCILWCGAVSADCLSRGPIFLHATPTSMVYRIDTAIFTSVKLYVYTRQRT